MQNWFDYNDIFTRPVETIPQAGRRAGQAAAERAAKAVNAQKKQNQARAQVALALQGYREEQQRRFGVGKAQQQGEVRLALQGYREEQQRRWQAQQRR